MENIKDLKLNFLIQTIAVFLVMSFLAIAAANSMLTGKVVYTSTPVQPIYLPPSSPPYEPIHLEAFQFLVSFFLATLLMLLFLKLWKGKFLFELFFSGTIIFGAQFPLGIFLGRFEAFIASVAVIMARFVHPRIWTQNLAVIIGISGVAAALGLGVRPLMALILLIILSVYDIIAVYKTRHMVKLFKGMAKRGAVLALVVPKDFFSWLKRFDSITPENKDEYVFLGTGDLALPLFFAVSVFPSGIEFSLFVILGAICGLAMDHLIFIKQREKKAIPALPAVALFSIAGYAIAFILGLF